jgi:hypothetical protein
VLGIGKWQIEGRKFPALPVKYGNAGHLDKILAMIHCCYIKYAYRKFADWANFSIRRKNYHGSMISYTEKKYWKRLHLNLEFQKFKK